MTNLPDPVTTSMLPGWSDRDVYLQRQMEKIEEQMDKLPEWLRKAILWNEIHKIPADFGHIAARCDWLYEALTWDDDSYYVIATVEEARNLAMAVDAGPEEDEG